MMFTVPRSAITSIHL